MLSEKPPVWQTCVSVSVCFRSQNVTAHAHSRFVSLLTYTIGGVRTLSCALNLDDAPPQTRGKNLNKINNVYD